MKYVKYFSFVDLKDQINPAQRLPLFAWPCLTEIHRQTGMFAFPEKGGLADLSKKKEKQRQTDREIGMK